MYTSIVPVDIDAVVIANTRLTPDYNVLALDAPDIAAVSRPGQFVMIKPTRSTDPLLRRPFSVFQLLRDRSGGATGLTILNKRIGVGTGLLYEVEPGSRLACLGPLGRPFDPAGPPAEAWMVAGGVGLAPFMTLAASLVALGTKATLFYGARRASELYFVDAFEQMGVRTVLATEDGSRGVRGLITSPLEAALRQLVAHSPVRLYVCGPTSMMHAVARLAEAHGRPCEVSLEQVMGCGLGGCYSCVVATRDAGGPPHFVRSCLDGPVFESRRIVWDALVH